MPNRRQAIIWTNAYPIHWCIYAALGWDELTHCHYDDVIMTMLASQITSLPVVCSIVYSDVNQRKHQSSASLAFVREIHRGPVNFPHKWPVTRKMFPFDDVIMWHNESIWQYNIIHVMDCCLTAPSLYLSQCWFLIIEVRGFHQFTWKQVNTVCASYYSA